jgi:hypothetical protein
LTTEIVIIANKQDLPGSLKPSIVQRLMGMRSFGLTAIDPNDRWKALDIIQTSLERDVDLGQMEFEPIDFVP